MNTKTEEFKKIFNESFELKKIFISIKLSAEQNLNEEEKKNVK